MAGSATKASETKHGATDDRQTSNAGTSAKQPGGGSKHSAGGSKQPLGGPKQPITVLFDRVLVQMHQGEGERRSRAGIVIPATAQISKRLVWAEAVAVGPHVRAVKAGDNVLFNPEDRFEFELQGDEYVILRERDVHAVASERIDGGTGLYL